MGDASDPQTASLRAEIAALLAAALQSDDVHDQQMADVQELHDAQAAVSQRRHEDQMAAATAAHDHEVDGLHHALATRDLIGQAKCIIMVAMSCSPEEAFALLVKQSQAENRKLVDIAADITANVQRRPRKT
jgi:hypothetical protein